MNSFFQNAAPLLFLTFSLTWLVGAIPTLRHWKEIHLHYFISFSAGVLLSTAFLHILPEVIEHGSPHGIGYGILAGFLFLFILEKFVMIHPCDESGCDYHSIGLAAFIGISLHSLFDGIALGSSFLVPGLAKAVFIAIIVHKMPSSFALASLLKAARWPHGRIHLFLFFFSLIIPVSALLSFLLLEHLSQSVVSLALNFSLGSFLYIATSDFLPQIHKKYTQKVRNFLAFILGILVMGVFSSSH